MGVYVQFGIMSFFKSKSINLCAHQVHWYVVFDNLIFYKSTSFASTTSVRICRPPHLMNRSWEKAANSPMVWCLKSNLNRWMMMLKWRVAMISPRRHILAAQCRKAQPTLASKIVSPIDCNTPSRWTSRTHWRSKSWVAPKWWYHTIEHHGLNNTAAENG